MRSILVFLVLVIVAVALAKDANKPLGGDKLGKQEARGVVNGGQNNNGVNFGGINNREARGVVNGGQNNNGVNFGGINNRQRRHPYNDDCTLVCARGLYADYNRCTCLPING